MGGCSCGLHGGGRRHPPTGLPLLPPRNAVYFADTVEGRRLGLLPVCKLFTPLYSVGEHVVGGRRPGPAGRMLGAAYDGLDGLFWSLGEEMDLNGSVALNGLRCLRTLSGEQGYGRVVV